MWCSAIDVEKRGNGGLTSAQKIKSKTTRKLLREAGQRLCIQFRCNKTINWSRARNRSAIEFLRFCDAMAVGARRLETHKNRVEKISDTRPMMWISDGEPISMGKDVQRGDVMACNARREQRTPTAIARCFAGLCCVAHPYFVSVDGKRRAASKTKRQWFLKRRSRINGFLRLTWIPSPARVPVWTGKIECCEIMWSPTQINGAKSRLLVLVAWHFAEEKVRMYSDDLLQNFDGPNLSMSTHRSLRNILYALASKELEKRI